MNAALDAALAYALRGWRVLPLEPRGKHPLGWLVNRGVHGASSDPGIIRRWWEKEPHANVGIACGDVSDLVVLDVDPRHGGDEALSKYDVPVTVRALTGGGGEHYFFRLGKGARPVSKLATGLDVQRAGKYIVAPPSAHPSGAAYRWDAGAHPDETPLADMPAWLAAPPPEPAADRFPASGKGRKYAMAALARAVSAVERAPIGERNDTLNREVWSIARLVASGDLTEQFVRDAFIDAATVNRLGLREAERTIDSAMKRVRA
jgi:hypothetical protein